MDEVHQIEGGMEPNHSPTASAVKDGPLDIEAVVAQHEAALLRYAARLAGNPVLAQDVVQDAFIRLVRHWRDGARPAVPLVPWLYRVTHNLAVDYIRREDRLRRLHARQAEETAPDVPTGQRRQVERQEALQWTQRFLRELDPAEQQVAILRLQEGRSYKEISEITGRSTGNVGCLLHHAAKHLAEKLKQVGAI
ncbi:MAG: sigma-70 family RNA polymerase sigma factor [Kiritimatiellaeota bacterium]|nr:sigma-70 family RNA polymerase sigma factor [Kiritimatiellota bacterium]